MDSTEMIKEKKANKRRALPNKFETFEFLKYKFFKKLVTKKLSSPKYDNF